MFHFSSMPYTRFNFFLILCHFAQLRELQNLANSPRWSTLSYRLLRPFVYRWTTSHYFLLCKYEFNGNAHFFAYRFVIKSSLHTSNESKNNFFSFFKNTFSLSANLIRKSRCEVIINRCANRIHWVLTGWSNLLAASSCRANRLAHTAWLKTYKKL